MFCISNTKWGSETESNTFQVEECEIAVLYQSWSTPTYQLLDPITCQQKANPLYYKGKLLGAKILKSKHADATMNQAANEVVKVINNFKHLCGTVLVN